MQLDTPEEIKKTDVWQLYDEARNYMRSYAMFTDSDRNYRFYNGNQWEGLRIEGIEPVQINYIKPVVDYKTVVLNENLWGIVFSAENYEDKEFQPYANLVCEMLTRQASRIWERTKMDNMIRNFTIDSCVNDEGVIYSFWNSKDKLIHNQILNKTDIYFGNENSDDLQNQPYILLKKRVPVSTARKMAKDLGVSKDKIDMIKGDQNNQEEIGEAKNLEKDDNVTIVTKLWKENGTVWYEKATEYVVLEKAKNSGCKRYPVVTFNWSEKKGYSRGEGVVRNLIANQIEVNKTYMRSLVVIKNTAYPQKVVKIDSIVNPEAVEEVGGTIEVEGATEDVKSVFQTTTPAQMSTDVEKMRNELVEVTRRLENAGDITTGSVNPENASGRAILAVQNASRQSLNDQASRLKNAIEDLALIWLDMITTYTKGSITLQYEQKDPLTGEKKVIPMEVQKTTLENLIASVKIDVTPKGVYDQYAQEQSLENLLTNGFFNIQRLDELEAYIETLPDDSTMPKQRIKDWIEKQRAKQRAIQQIENQGAILQESMNQYLNGGLELQAEVNNRMNQMQNGNVLYGNFNANESNVPVATNNK